MTAQTANPPVPRNPYKSKPGYGISVPEYYRPTPSVTNRNFFPPNEVLAEGELRLCFVGSTPWPPTLAQSGTCIMAEFGNGTAVPRRMFFDLGNGSVKNILSLGVVPPMINDIFISHLHVDHYADLPYIHPFRAWSGGWYSPMRVYGPSGARPNLGVTHMITKMKEMMVWHLENFDHCPIGDGYEVEVTEFDWKDENGICYDVAVVNTDKNAIWQRYAIRPEHASVSPPDPREVMAATGKQLPPEIPLPQPRLPREKQQEQFLRDMEIDKSLYYPPDANREIVQKWPTGFALNVQDLINARGGVTSKAKK
jgi:ribonuclease BN (tRNA processing enzyme)